MPAYLSGSSPWDGVFSCGEIDEGDRKERICFPLLSPSPPDIFRHEKDMAGQGREINCSAALVHGNETKFECLIQRIINHKQLFFTYKNAVAN